MDMSICMNDAVNQEDATRLNVLGYMLWKYIGIYQKG